MFRAVPSVDENRQAWDGYYTWPLAGDEWSAAWGDTRTEWRATVLPRIQPFLPARTLLEIAPGFGRWTEFLLPLSERYVGVDLSEAGVEACRKRFADVPHAEFHVNDGRSLDAVPDGSVDLAFSFDSLVHVEDDVIGGYLQELARKLSADGVAVIHHSNLAGCKPVGRVSQLAFSTGEKVRGRTSVGLNHWRASSMSAERFERLASDAGLSCVGQEKLNWVGSRLIDCISVVTRPGSRWHRPNVVVENPYFTAEVASASCVSQVYTTLEPAGATLVPQHNGSGMRYFGLSSTMIAARSVGPWAVSVLGPWPKWRELLQRKAGRTTAK